MSFQAHLDTIEARTGLTPRELLAVAAERGLDGPDTKAGSVVEWLEADHRLGRGHAMALFHVIENGPRIDSKHIGSSGSHRDETDVLWLDGIATKPSGETAGQ